MRLLVERINDLSSVLAASFGVLAPSRFACAAPERPTNEIVKEMFRELRADGAALLISTHMIDSVEDYWDVAHIMMHGSLAAVKRPDDGGERSLEELFFDITEGGEASA